MLIDFRPADQWAQNRDFFSCCGPTEATTVNIMYKHKSGYSLSIGRPVPNTTVYILDENEDSVRIGASGVMWVGGDCISKGYVNLREVTSSRHRPDKFLTDGWISHPEQLIGYTNPRTGE